MKQGGELICPPENLTVVSQKDHHNLFENLSDST